MRETQTEVLVVGAGPVGLLSALFLAQAGVQVTIIDREQRVTARSYACALHASVLDLCDKLGLLQSILERSRRISRVRFYDHEKVRATVDLSALNPRYPYIVTLPQSELEQLLEQQLKKLGVSVHWNFRFRDFLDEPEQLEASLEELGGTATGYVVPHWEMVVKNQRQLRTQFIIGADGFNSTVRQRLGVSLERSTEVSSFAAYEFEAVEPVPDELSVVLDGTTNVLWPLPNNRCRWTFQLLHTELAEFPEKERRSARLANPNVDERIRAYVQTVAAKRAPWFKSGVKDIAWCTEVSFSHQTVKEFGRNRCWLIGDAAHQTGPVGVQSMNSGLIEASAVAEGIRKVVRQEAGLETLRTFGERKAAEWLRLIGLAPGLQPLPNTDSWVRQNAARILPCLPALGTEVSAAATQLGLSWS